MRHLLLVLSLLLGGSAAAWAQVARVEYFVDDDPGLGRATPVAVTPGADVTASFTVPLTSTAPGFHALYLRTRDAQRHWSLTSAQAFFVTTLAPTAQTLAAAEYFIDQDPGSGQGTAITLTAGQTQATLAFNVNLTTISPGFHALYLRTRSTQGNWSHTQAHSFYALSLPPAGQALTRAEYFIDQDPGPGQGTALTLPAGQQQATLAFNVNLATTSVGAHVLYSRVADKNGAWSAAAAQAFLVKPGGSLVNVQAFKYVFTRTGYVSDTLTYQLPTPAPSVSLNFVADLSRLPGNQEYDMSIWAVASNGLRSLVQVRRIKACNSLPAKAAFEFAQDGHQVFPVNGSTEASTYSWDFGDGTTSTLTSPQHTYAAIGNYSVRLIASSVCNADTVTKTVSIQGIKSITTNHGGNTGVVSVVVTGAGFVPRMQLLLRRVGQADVTGDTVITRSVSTLTTRFNLSGKSVGLWDVVVIFPGGATATLSNGFTIENGIAPRLAVSITGSNTLRIGFNQIYTISYKNLSNIDANMVPLLITGLPQGTQIDIASKNIKLDSLPGHANLNIPDTLRKYTLNDTAYHMSLRMLFLSKIPANSARTLNVIFHLPVSTPLNTRLTIGVTIGKPLLHYASNGGIAVNRLFTPLEDFTCFSEINKVATEITLEKLLVIFPSLDLTGIPTCYLGKDALQATLAGDYVKYNEDEGYGEKILELYEYTLAIVPTALSCVQAGLTTTAVNAPLLAPEILALSTELFAARVAVDAFLAIPVAIKKNVDIVSNCAPLVTEAVFKAYNSLLAVVRNASDPNTKYGPGAGSAHHYINKDAPLAYTIGFENLPTANINAQTVRVTDTLSAQAFNRASFAFTSVTVGEKTYALPAPAKSFVHDFDFVTQYGVKARVVGTYDEATGIVRWTFFSINPATNQVTTSALDGFLPPNTVSPKGQGYVSFTVQANAARQTGDLIRNRASIVFDFNSAIRTNVWANTFDLVRPTSTVTAVVPTQATQLRVSWTGTDVGSGIQSYDVYYTTNGRTARRWLSGTGLTSDLFTGQRDSTYCFYSVARDSAGNVEATPATPGMCRTVVLSQLATTLPDRLEVYPNPTLGAFTMAITARQATSTTVVVEDVVGRVVYRHDLRLGSGPQRQELDISALPPGVYFVRLKLDGEQLVRRLLKQ